ncbi:MAG: putative nucleotidyltransferase, partial [Chitinophagaceae bacterium]|nr:putative nucleotidyltransferase [Chitinophagaceae bacterium]
NIRILYACETGSRAWGFPSPDSDYDIRFIYMHPANWYLELNEKKDSIEQTIAGDLDISGWDLRKSLLLLKRSNAPLIERFNSPIEYFSVDGFKQEFGKLIEYYYSPVAVFYHHYSLAQKFRADIIDREEVKLKGLFYLVRSLLSCYWIMQDNTVVPMELERLMTILDDTKRKELRALVQLKSTVGEKYLHKTSPALLGWIETLWTDIDAAKNSLRSSSNDYTLLNEFFIRMLNDTNDR